MPLCMWAMVTVSVLRAASLEMVRVSGVPPGRQRMPSPRCSTLSSSTERL
jgi:hypothetical protein